MSTWIDLGPCGCCGAPAYPYYPYSSYPFYPYYGAGGPVGPFDVVTVPCCPSPMPRMIFATVSSSCGLINGLTIPLIYDDASGCWLGFQDGIICTNCSRFFAQLCCIGGTWSGGGGFEQGPSDPLPCDLITAGSPSFSLTSCSPLIATYTGNYKSVGSPSCCSNFSFTITFTE